MPSFGDSAVIFLIALLLFGPKKLPELARQLGKLMGEFRRASNEFRMQMEEEFRAIEQEDRQKKISAIEAAAPVGTPAALPEESSTVTTEATEAAATEPEYTPAQPESEPESPEPVAIATAGDLEMMPPETGLPVSRSPLASVVDSIPRVADPEVPNSNSNGHHSAQTDAQEAEIHG